MNSGNRNDNIIEKDDKYEYVLIDDDPSTELTVMCFVSFGLGVVSLAFNPSFISSIAALVLSWFTKHNYDECKFDIFRKIGKITAIIGIILPFASLLFAVLSVSGGVVDNIFQSMITNYAPKSNITTSPYLQIIIDALFM